MQFSKWCPMFLRVLKCKILVQILFYLMKFELYSKLTLWSKISLFLDLKSICLTWKRKRIFELISLTYELTAFVSRYINNFLVSKCHLHQCFLTGEPHTILFPYCQFANLAGSKSTKLIELSKKELNQCFKICLMGLCAWYVKNHWCTSSLLIPYNDYNKKNIFIFF